MPYTREISIKELTNLRIGHASDEKAKTGVTVLYFPNGARVGCDISGGGPASRETTLTSPVTADNPINAIVLSGGSAYGLAAADGVMRFLESQGIGYPTGPAVVPLVCQSCIYDLGYGSASVRPDAAMGEEACRHALACTDSRIGNIGVGIGAVIHNWIPEDIIIKVLGTGNPFGVILATIAGIPMYADIFGTIPIAEALLAKGAQLGVVLAFMMGVTTLSLPSIILLRKAIKPRLLALFVAICTVGIIGVGYFFNAVQGIMM